MNVNENIALVHVGFDTSQAKRIRALEENIMALLHLWRKNNYTIIPLALGEEESAATESQSSKKDKVTSEIQIRAHHFLSRELQENHFSRIVVLGVAETSVLDGLLQFAQAHKMILYQVSDALYCPKGNELLWNMRVRNVTTAQILTLSRGIRDKK